MADKLGEGVVEIRADMSGLKSDLAQMQAALAGSINNMSAQAKALGDALSAPMRDMAAQTQALGSSVSKQTQHIRGMEGETRKLSGTVSGVVTSAKHLAAAFGLYLGGRQLLGFVKSSITAANEEEAAALRLATSLQKIGAYSEAAMNRHMAFAMAMHRATLYDDEAVQGLMSIGAALGYLSGQALEDATKAAIGWAELLKIDVNTAMMMVAKAAQGNFASWARYSGALKDAQTPAEKMAIILREGAAEFKIHEESAKSSAGQTRQLAKAWGELKETFGKGIKQGANLDTTIRRMTQAVDGGASSWLWFGRVLGVVGQVIAQLAGAMVDLVRLSAGTLKLLIGETAKALDWLNKKHVDLIPFQDMKAGRRMADEALMARANRVTQEEDVLGPLHRSKRNPWNDPKEAARLRELLAEQETESPLQAFGRSMSDEAMEDIGRTLDNRMTAITDMMAPFETGRPKIPPITPGGNITGDEGQENERGKGRATYGMITPGELGGALSARPAGPTGAGAGLSMLSMLGGASPMMALAQNRLQLPGTGGMLNPLARPGVGSGITLPMTAFEAKPASEDMQKAQLERLAEIARNTAKQGGVTVQ